MIHHHHHQLQYQLLWHFGNGIVRSNSNTASAAAAQDSILIVLVIVVCRCPRCTRPADCRDISYPMSYARMADWGPISVATCSKAFHINTSDRRPATSNQPPATSSLPYSIYHTPYSVFYGGCVSNQVMWSLYLSERVESDSTPYLIPPWILYTHTLTPASSHTTRTYSQSCQSQDIILAVHSLHIHMLGKFVDFSFCLPCLLLALGVLKTKRLSSASTAYE